MKIGFIGYGNMGKMIINNILSLNLLNEEEIIVSTRTIAKLDLLKEKYPKITTTSNNNYLAQNSDKIFIFVKTPQFQEVMEEIKLFLGEKKHIIHICFGVSFQDVNTVFNGPVSQIIPSIASSQKETTNIKKTTSQKETTNIKKTTSQKETTNIKEKLNDSDYRKKGISLIIHNETVHNNDKEFVEELFNEFSHIKIIDVKNSDDLEVATVLTSCGPAFIALLVKITSKIASRKSRLTMEETKEMIVKTLFGTSILLSNLDYDKIAMNPEEIIEKVATKKGITQKGLDYLDPEIERLINELFEKIFKTKWLFGSNRNIMVNRNET